MQCTVSRCMRTLIHFRIYTYTLYIYIVMIKPCIKMRINIIPKDKDLVSCRVEVSRDVIPATVAGISVRLRDQQRSSCLSTEMGC